jgi:hypothetical protein
MLSLEAALANVETEVEAVSAALLATDPPVLELRSTALRQAAAELAEVMRRTHINALPPDLAKRLQAVGASVDMQRDNLARVAALTDRQVAAVLPPSDATTYGARAGGTAARIYKSAG